MDDINGRAGSHSWGYTEPTEAAWELLEEAVAPFVEDMKRYLGLGLDDEAFEVCKGIVFGLYQCHDESGDEFLSWAGDFLAEASGSAVDDWIGARRQGPTSGASKANRARQLREFVMEHVPDWQWISRKAVGRRHVRLAKMKGESVVRAETAAKATRPKRGLTAASRKALKVLMKKRWAAKRGAPLSG